MLLAVFDLRFRFRLDYLIGGYPGLEIASTKSRNLQLRLRISILSASKRLHVQYILRILCCVIGMIQYGNLSTLNKIKKIIFILCTV